MSFNGSFYFFQMHTVKGTKNKSQKNSRTNAVLNNTTNVKNHEISSLESQLVAKNKTMQRSNISSGIWKPLRKKTRGDPRKGTARI